MNTPSFYTFKYKDAFIHVKMVGSVEQVEVQMESKLIPFSSIVAAKCFITREVNKNKRLRGEYDVET